MLGFELKIAESLSALSGLIGETAQQQSIHRQRQPHFPPAAAGRGFSAHGQALAEMLERLHGGVDKRINAFAQTTQAAELEVQRFEETDRIFGAGFDGIEHK
ncbi:hypothetical protein [Corynebacterium crudilactis]|uniref:Uncharacterized protein n=1 Tax=Corynebacterium crudilactis TaxID=1652495 RepID=A0A172QRF9_9CORY|nr:hypothetical protein [Corynebacterium crudilactis]ANE03277.1 hypothetical protein ccrud_02980 [Corynebacterium crudilactis]